MKVLDGRNEERTLREIEVPDKVMEHDEEWRDDGCVVFWVRMDGKIVGCAQYRNPDGTRTDPILCMDFEDMALFERWIPRFVDHPYRFDRKADEVITRARDRAVELSHGMDWLEAIEKAVAEEKAKGTFLTKGLVNEIRMACREAFCGE